MGLAFDPYVVIPNLNNAGYSIRQVDGNNCKVKEGNLYVTEPWGSYAAHNWHVSKSNAIKQCQRYAAAELPSLREKLTLLEAIEAGDIEIHELNQDNG